MNQRTIQILFALLRSAIRGTALTEEERNCITQDLIRDILKISCKHDMAHLVGFGLMQNELISENRDSLQQCIFAAVYRYEQINYEFENLCAALEKAKIQFLPLKGSVIRKYYPEAWMRTSCDIDILIRHEDLYRAISYLADHHHYIVKEYATHDVSLFSPSGIHVELHFDLVEEGRAQNAIDVLKTVWENVVLHENSEYWYEMADDYFYFYHIAHMAKHFENGGCGIRPFIDLWILDHVVKVDRAACDYLLNKGNLLKFANASRALRDMWFEGDAPDALSLQMQDFLLHSGVYGSADNRVALQQKNKGGRIGYLLSRMFVPYVKLKRYYPVLEKYRWLMPVMQVRRWFMLLKPDVAKMAKAELAANSAVDATYAAQMGEFLKKIGLQ